MATLTDAGGRAIQRRVKTGCLTCRKRHMKCDERKPRCRHCEVASRTCEFPSPVALDDILTRLDSDEITTFDFPSDHVWVETPPSLRFIHHVKQSDWQLGDTTSTSDLSPQSTIPHTSVIQRPPFLGLPNGDATALSPTVPATFVSPGAELPGSYSSQCSPAQSLNSNLSIYTPRPRSPLEDPQRAFLMRHYIDNLSGWLDLNDPLHHFSIAVPHLAMTCPMLLDAVFAFSARDLSRRVDPAMTAVSTSTSPTSPLSAATAPPRRPGFAYPHRWSEVADTYHDSCVHRLIPALEDASLIAESALPLSTVILRMHEMLGSHVADVQRHLRGCVSLFRHNRNSFRRGSLQHAAFWAYVRQEILTALAGRDGGCATHVDTSDATYRVVFTGMSDDEWTDHITWLAARVVNHCFGGVYPRDDPDSPVVPSRPDPERWEALRREVDGWRGRLPDSFRPLSVVTDDRPFPIVTYLCTWHVIAMQFYHICKVLLALHYPLQATGINMLRSFRYIETEVAEHTAQLCGIVRGLVSSESCRHPGTLVNAAELLIVCGRTLKSQEERASVLCLLHRIEDETTWPIDRAIRSLEEEWEGQMDL